MENWRFDGLDDGDFYIVEIVATLAKNVANGEFFRVCVDVNGCAVCSLGKFIKNMNKSHRMAVMFPFAVCDEDDGEPCISDAYLEHYDGTTSHSEVGCIYLVSVQGGNEKCRSQQG